MIKRKSILGNKKGDLTNNVLSVIVAVIGIGILIFGIVKLYGLFSEQEEKNAKNFLESLSEKISSLKEGQKNEFIMQGFKGSENWYVLGYSKEEARPEKCFFDSCVCICKGNSESGLPPGFIARVDSEKKFFDVNGNEIKQKIAGVEVKYDSLHESQFISVCQGDTGVGFCSSFDEKEVYTATVNDGKTEGAGIPYIKLRSNLINVIVVKPDKDKDEKDSRIEIFDDPFSLLKK